MPLKVQILAVASSLGLLAFILYLIRKGRLREEHALLWLMAGFSILILSAWRGSLTAIARMLNIGYAPSLLFAVGLVFTLLILLAQTAVMSRVSSHTRDLAQELSLMEWRIEKLERELSEQRERDEDEGGRLPVDGWAAPSAQPLAGGEERESVAATIGSDDGIAPGEEG